ncbi:MAG: lipoprotein [Paludibacteraceae bacterium]|nr:lipoprotein [Paludibacteraceae bacterium]
MKKIIFLACAALVVSAAAVVGVKAYCNPQMSDLH